MPKKSYAGGVKQHIVLFSRYVMRGLQPVRDEDLVVSGPWAREMSIGRLEGVCSDVLATFYCRNIFFRYCSKASGWRAVRIPTDLTGALIF